MMKRNKRGSALVMTLFLVFLAALAMSRFIEKAYSEILGEALYVERDRLRLEAYSALEMTAAVLFETMRVESNLFAPEQGWGDPLAHAQIPLPEGLSVQVEFVDEMGKISLPTAGRERLLRLFEVLGFGALEAEDLTDALMEWVSPTPGVVGPGSHVQDYERAEIPYRPSQRPLRSFHELAAIAGFSEAFFEQGVPNELFYRLTQLASLYRFNQVNLNSASPEVLRIWANMSEQDAINLGRQLDRSHRGQHGYFRNITEAVAHFGIPLPETMFGVSTTCIRANIYVTEGGSTFALSTVVAPSGAAANLMPANPQQTQAENGAQPPRRGAQRAGRAGQRQAQGQPGEAQPPAPPRNQQQAVPYPFAFLEIRENESIL